MLHTSNVGTRTLGIDADSDQVLVILHQDGTLSGKTAFVAFSFEDVGGDECSVEGQYQTGVHEEAARFYECTTEYFRSGVASCAGYGDVTPTYWQFDPTPIFEE